MLVTEQQQYPLHLIYYVGYIVIIFSLKQQELNWTFNILD